MNFFTSLAPADQRVSFNFIEGSIRSTEDCYKVCSVVDSLVHKGALGSAPHSVVDPVTINTVNITGLLNYRAGGARSRGKKFYVCCKELIKRCLGI